MRFKIEGNNISAASDSIKAISSSTEFIQKFGSRGISIVNRQEIAIIRIFVPYSNRTGHQDLRTRGGNEFQVADRAMGIAITATTVVIHLKRCYPRRDNDSLRALHRHIYRESRKAIRKHRGNSRIVTRHLIRNRIPHIPCIKSFNGYTIFILNGITLKVISRTRGRSQRYIRIHQSCCG